MSEKVVIGNAELWHGDCREVLPLLDAFDAVVCDPPYPDYHAEAYGYEEGLLEPLRLMACRQFIFWSSKADFPLSHCAVHIWDKKTGCGSQYERLYERNGQAAYKVYRQYLINSTVAASYTGDEWTGHPSQKPLRLMQQVVSDATNIGASVLDPWMGSGSTGLACLITGRRFTGIERERKYFDIACERIARAQAQGQMFAPESATLPTQQAMDL